MSTHAAIIRKTETGTFEGVYLHNDGYPSYAGRILLDHYQDAAKVEALINLGDLSLLAERCEPTGPHSFGSPEEGVTIAYGRDRGERNVEKHVGHSVQSLKNVIEHGGNLYVFAEGAWTHNGKPLAELLNA